VTSPSLLPHFKSCSCLRHSLRLSCHIGVAPTSLHVHMCSMLFTCLSGPHMTLILLLGATVTGSTMTVEGCGSDSLQGDVRFAEVMGLMGAQVQWHPYSITITGVPLHGWPSFALQICPDVSGYKTRAHILPLCKLKRTCSWSSAAILSEWQLPKQAVHKCTMLACCWTCACAGCCFLPS